MIGGKKTPPKMHFECVSEELNFEEAVRNADQLMYIEKEKSRRKTGI